MLIVRWIVAVALGLIWVLTVYLATRDVLRKCVVTFEESRYGLLGIPVGAAMILLLPVGRLGVRACWIPLTLIFAAYADVLIIPLRMILKRHTSRRRCRQAE